MKTLLTLVAATALSISAVAADTMKIDDDGWSWVETQAQDGPLIDIDDDGWSYVEPQPVRSGRTFGEPGSCTKLESSAGLSGDDCGVLSRSEVIQVLMRDDDD